MPALLICPSLTQARDFLVTADADGKGRDSLIAAINDLNNYSERTNRIIFTEEMEIDVSDALPPLPQIEVPVTVEITGEEIDGYDGTPLVVFRGSGKLSGSYGLQYASSPPYDPTYDNHIKGIAFEDVRVGIVLNDLMTRTIIEDCRFARSARGIEIAGDFEGERLVDGLIIGNNHFSENIVAVELLPTMESALKNVWFADNRFESNEVSINVRSSDKLNIEHNIFSNTSDVAISLENTVDTTISEDNQFTDNTFAIVSGGGSNITIENNQIDSTENGTGIWLHSSPAPGVSIIDNTIEGNGYIGIALDDRSYSFVNISGNTVSGKQVAVHLGYPDSNTGNDTIQSNTIYDNETGIHIESYFFLDEYVNLSILENILTNNGSGIVLDHCGNDKSVRIEETGFENNVVGLLLNDSDATLVNNYFVGNEVGSSTQTLEDSNYSQKQIFETENQFYDNDTGLLIEASVNLFVESAVFQGNGKGIDINADGISQIKDSYFGGADAEDANNIGIRVGEKTHRLHIGLNAQGNSYGGSAFVGNTEAAILVQPRVGQDLADEIYIRDNIFGVSGSEDSDSIIIGGVRIYIEDNTMLENFGGLDCSKSSGQVFVRRNEISGGQITFSKGIVYEISENIMSGRVPLSFSGDISYAEIRNNALTGPVLIQEGAEVGLIGNEFSGTGIDTNGKLVDLALGTSNPGNRGIASPTAISAIQSSAGNLIEGVVEEAGVVEIYSSNALGTTSFEFLASVEVAEAGPWSTEDINLEGVNYVIANLTRDFVSNPSHMITSEFSMAVQVQGETADFEGMDMDSSENIWTSDQGGLSADTENKTEGAASLQIDNSGWTKVSSPSFNTAVLGVVGTQLAVDVYLPDIPANTQNLQAWATIPGAGVNDAYLGYVDLLSKPRGTWSTVQFSVPDYVRRALLGDYANARISLALNTEVHPVLLDNLRFTGELTERTIFHVLGSSTYPVVTNDMMSFDNPQDWSSSVALTREFVLRTQGNSALGVAASDFTVVQSRVFSTTELSDVIDELNIDVYIPRPQPNQWWVGDVQLYITCGPLDNELIGLVDITNRFQGEFNSLRFPLSNVIYNVLNADHSDCSLSIALNVATDAGTFVLDNLGFIQNSN